MNNNFKPIVITIAFGNKNAARELGKKLVEQKLVACAQLFPIQSIYRWDNAIQADDECLLQAKTTEANIENIEKLVTKEHSYEVPEIIATSIVWGHQPYLQWLADNTRESE